jgi:hypothetical protein
MKKSNYLDNIKFAGNLMNSPGLQAGDQKAHTFPLATRRPLGGEWQGKLGAVSLPRLKSRGYS